MKQDGKVQKDGVFKEAEYFRRFCLGRGLKNSAPRREVLRAFVETEGHIDARDLYDILRERGKRIGYATVWRTLKLLVQCGLAREVQLAGKEARFEHAWAHTHHDHLVCLGCGRTFEFFDPKIEELQERAAKRHGFKAERHSMVIFGLCKRCC